MEFELVIKDCKGIDNENCFLAAVGSSSESDSDTEWGINSNDLPSCVLIHGPPGCGKTSSVFAVANTLGYKVCSFGICMRYVLRNLC